MSSYTKRSSARRSDDTMDEDGEDKDDTKRKSRNLSEKKRRDQFNMLVNELSSMVATGARKMDKSTVLRSTISFLKNHNEIAIRSRAHEIQEDWKPAFLSNEEFTHLILEALDGFIVVFSAAGHVHYVSESVTALLGHLPSELLNTSVYELVWDEEQAALYQALVGGGGTGGSGGGNSGTLAFQAHLRRARPHPAEDTYELVNFQGYLRTDVDTLDTPPTYTADTRLFVGTGRLHTPQLIREMSLVDTGDVDSGGRSSGSPGEFTSRHSLEWKFLFLDHRAPPIIGYLPFEVLGTSGYDYYHVDDLDKVVSCHEALMQKGEGTSCYYRFLTKGQQWIWLQTRFYITYHQWNSKPEFIVCTHRVVSYVDVMKQTRVDLTSSSTPGGMLDSSPAAATSTPGSGASSPWAGAGTPRQRHAPRRTPSDCTSMSADSPASASAPRTQGGRSSRLSSHSHNTGSGVGPTLGPGPSSGAPTAVLFAEPPPQPQYVAAIPVQSAVIAGFPAPTAAVLSPIPQAVDSGSMSGSDSNPPTAALQAQLQRKHAELQAIIGQQQAELRRVSEQLLMARLGLLAPAPPPGQHHHQQPQPQHHPHPAMLTAVSVPYVCNSNVSSTTTSAPAGPGGVVHPRPDDASAMALGQQQAQMLFTQPQPSSSSTHPQN